MRHGSSQANAMENKIRTIVRQLKGETSASPVDQQDGQPDAQLEKDLTKLWEKSGQYQAAGFQPNVEQNWQRFQERIRTEEKPELRVFPLRRLLAIAASFLLIAITAWWWIQGHTPPDWQVLTAGANEVKTIRLPDQSIVTLYKGATLRLAKPFEQDQERLVKLEGEAFFDVQRDPHKPFRIETSDGRIEVLGTSFNVRSKSQRTEVEVSTGKVAIYNRASNAKTELLAGESGLVDAQQQPRKLTQKHPVQELPSNLWRTGSLSLRNSSFDEVRLALERYAGLDLRFSQPNIAQCFVSGTIHLEKPLVFIENAALASGLEFERIDDKTILLKGEGCK
jgi:transmembrane sensor